MILEDDAKAAEYLQRIGYYRLSAYWHPMRKRDPGSGDVLDDFIDGATFKEATDLYTFDSRLRLIALDALERLEVSLRTEVALTLGKYGPKAHLDVSFFNRSFVSANKIGAPSKHRIWLQRLEKRFLESKDKFAEHFRAKYPNDHMPIWIAVELLEFGSLSHLISGMKFPDLKAIGESYAGISPKQIGSWAHSLSFTRNVCAHHSRLWNKPLINQPALGGSETPPDLIHTRGAPGGTKRFYTIACVMQFMLRAANPRTSWRDRFISHIDTFPESPRLDLSAAGFPADWKEQSLWAV